MKALTKFQKEKKCNKCGKIKLVNNFSRHGNSHPFSLKSNCKECEVKRVTEWIKKNREKFNRYQRKYRNEYKTAS